MFKKVVVGIISLSLGIGLGYLVINYRDKLPKVIISPVAMGPTTPNKSGNEVIGFLPYWLIDKAKDDYSKYITTLTYFGLTVDGSGKIVKFNNPGEAEPGWYALTSGKFDQMSRTAAANKLKLSLLIFASDPEEIGKLVADPVTNGKNLVDQVAPIMREYGFVDLNLDIENVTRQDSIARDNFVMFVNSVKENLKQYGIQSLTVEITANDSVNDKLIDVDRVGKIADYMVMMAYDYHYSGSKISGPVSPVGGGGKFLEFDVKMAVDEGLKKVDHQKLILGVPDYGYEWETLSASLSSATVPGSGQTASTMRVAKILSDCTNCVNTTNPDTLESFLSFQDPDGGWWHQIFYPGPKATAAKIQLIKEKKLAGMAIWALGYEDNQVLEPLSGFVKSN